MTVGATNKIKWAIVGCGSIADKRIAPALVASPVNRLVAVASRDAAKANAFAAKHAGARAYESYDELLSDPAVQVVYVGTPNAAHHDHVIAACRAGKHVFCDKPLALTVEECRAMDQAARAAGVSLGVGYNNRYNPVHEEMRRQVAAGNIGAVRFGTLLFAVNRPRRRWRLDAAVSGAGCLYDLGLHGIDLFRYLLNDEVTHVTAVLDVETHGWPLDEAASALLTFSSGACISLTVSSKIPHPHNAVALYGAKGTLMGTDTLISQIGGFIPPAGQLEVSTDAGTVRRDDFEVRDIFQAELDSFGRAVARGDAPEIGALDGLRAQEIALAMQQSFREGKTVSLQREPAHV